MSSTRKLLQEIAENQDFERLLAFQEAKTWKKLTDEDRELLATLFITLGERELAAGDPNAQRSFDTAAKIAPGNANIFYKQGLAYLRKATDGPTFLLACAAFDQASILNPGSFDIWFQCGIAHMRAGAMVLNADMVKRADACFREAQAVANEHSDKGLLLWRWGLCGYAAGRISGEACDFRSALEKFREAALTGVDAVAFWTDYGFLLRELGMLLHRPELLQEALGLFIKAAKMQPDYWEAWTGIALLSQKFYQISKDRTCFNEADRAFRVIATLRPLDSEMWLSWAQLALDYGKWHRDLEMLRTSLDRFEKIGQVDVGSTVVLSAWAEAQILVGGQLERLNLIQEGIEKCRRCLEQAPNHTRALYLQAMGLIELGRYFSDERYFESAVEGLKHAMTSRHDDPLLWYGFAQANFALGDVRRDRTLLERATHSCTQVIEYGGNGNSQFYNDWGVALLRLSEVSRDRRHLEQAVEKFEQAIAYHVRGKEPGVVERDGLDPEWLYNYGCALDFLGNATHEPKYHEKAIQVLSQVIILDANFSHARYNLALTFYHLAEHVNDLDCFHKSLELFQSVVEQDPEDDTAWTDWGEALISLSQLMRDPARPDLSLGLLEQAELKLRHAASLGSTGAFYHLACVYSLSGNLNAAMHYLDRALATNSLPSFEEVTHDEWLEALQDQPKFREWLNQLSNKPCDP